MKVINVSRVSTEEQKEAVNSLSAQIERVDSYCNKKDFTVIVLELADTPNWLQIRGSKSE